jgi:hypothetical protein
LEVDVLIPIHIEEARALAVIEIQRHGGLHLANAAVHAGGDAVLSTGEELRRLGEGVRHGWRR